ncbi:MAG: hypothetical protein IBX71_05480 [Candidatus Desulforudis sp.]|nr:hypothetical protein [Desulforudis sp.]
MADKKKQTEWVKLNNSPMGRLEMEEFKHRLAGTRRIQKKKTKKTVT